MKDSKTKLKEKLTVKGYEFLERLMDNDLDESDVANKKEKMDVAKMFVTKDINALSEEEMEERELLKEAQKVIGNTTLQKYFADEKKKLK